MKMPLKKYVSSKFINMYIFVLLLVMIFIIFSLLRDDFLTTRNIQMLLRHMSTNGLAALGLVFVVIVGHFDMSFHMVGCLAGITASYFIGNGFTPLPSILIGLLVGILFGSISGIAIGKFKLPDMIITIGTGSIAFGLGYLYSGGSFIYDNFLTSGILNINNNEWFSIPFPFILTILSYFIAYVLLNKSKYGRYFYATGKNKIAAIFSGVNVKAYVITGFIISAFLASMATIIITSAQGVGNVKAGLKLLMPAYASVYIGISIFKKPTVIGTLLGVLFTAIMLNGFTLMSVPFYFQDLIISCAMIVAIIVSKTNFTVLLNTMSSLQSSSKEELL